jgi:hypothetical protein
MKEVTYGWRVKHKLGDDTYLLIPALNWDKLADGEFDDKESAVTYKKVQEEHCPGIDTSKWILCRIEVQTVEVEEEEIL